MVNGREFLSTSSVVRYTVCQGIISEIPLICVLYQIDTYLLFTNKMFILDTMKNITYLFLSEIIGINHKLSAFSRTLPQELRFREKLKRYLLY